MPFAAIQPPNKHDFAVLPNIEIQVLVNEEFAMDLLVHCEVFETHLAVKLHFKGA